MKQSKESLENKLSNLCENIAINTELCNKIYDYAYDKYNLPRGLASDLICFRMDMSEASEFILFCLYESIIAMTSSKDDLDAFYTETEIAHYSKSRYKEDKLALPLRLKMIQVTDDQWIGSINSRLLMKFRAAQKINYNTNAQRVLTQVVHGDKVMYKITLNQSSVNEIRSKLEDNTFIPNSITLNLSTEIGNEFYYDNDSNELVITKLKYFYIPDGFHRYIAICKASDKNKDFDFNMELRIVDWDDARSLSFINQEDKRNKMKRVDVESMDMSKLSNIIVERLNNNIYCNMKGMIGRNDGIIKFGEMSLLVDWFYVKNNAKGSSNVIQIKAVRELIDNINTLTECDIKYLETHWNYKMLLSAMCVFDFCNKHQDHKKDMCRLVNEVYAEISQSNDKKFKNITPRKALIDMVMKVVETKANYI